MAVVWVRHNKVVTVPDDGTSVVGSDEWNEGHVVTGLENVDNTSDANKPVSTAQAAADAAVASAAASALTAGLANKVVGPAAVTDDLPAIFDGTTGKLIKSKTYAAFKTLLALVKGDVGLGNVDNTSDVNKPVSTAQAAADALKAPLASPALTGVPTAPTATAGTNTTQMATTAFVEAARVILAAADVLKAPLISPSFTTPALGVATGTSLQAGSVDLAPSVTNKVQASSASAVSLLALGQSTAANLNLLWNYNATPASASATIATFGYSNPLSIDGSALALNITSGGPVTTPTPTAGDSSTKVSTTAFVAGALRGHLSGLTLSTAGSSATFGIAAGLALNSTHAVLMALASAYTKTTSAWAVGSGNGALDTSSIAPSTWYHTHLIKRPDTGVVDVLVSLSATAPTLPTNYTVFRRIGSMRTNASSQWIKFIQDGDTFTWDVPATDVLNVANPGTASVTRTISTPLGVRVEAILSVFGNGAAQTDLPGAILISDLSVTDTAPSSLAAFTISVFTSLATATNFQNGGVVRVFTNTASQVRSRLQISAAGTTFTLLTSGWVDRRGRDA